MSTECKCGKWRFPVNVAPIFADTEEPVHEECYVVAKCPECGEPHAFMTPAMRDKLLTKAKEREAAGEGP